MSKIAILGSSGMIGSHLKALFISKNIEFINIDRNIWDLSQWKTEKELDLIFKDAEVVFNFAAVLPTSSDDETQLLFDVNVRSCLNLAQWATKREIPIVYLSGSTVYAKPNDNNILENNEKVTFGLGGLYGYTKLLAENIFNHFIPQGLKITILRPTSVYGIGLGSDKLINVFLKKASNSEMISLTESNNKINFIHAMDVSNSALITYKYKAYGTFNIAGNEMTSINELAKLSIDTVGSGMIGKVQESIKPFNRFNLNCDYAKNIFNFESKISIQDGIKAMYNNKYLEDLIS
jgi:nucleoside-diphosphate-sugar epimerase